MMLRSRNHNKQSAVCVSAGFHRLRQPESYMRCLIIYWTPTYRCRCSYRRLSRCRDHEACGIWHCDYKYRALISDLKYSGRRRETI